MVDFNKYCVFILLELDEFLLELDEDVEGMQSTIYYLQTQLREAKEQIAQLQKEKLEHSGASNGFTSNHLSNNTTSNCKSPVQTTILENSHSTTAPTESIIKSDLNGSNDTPVSQVKQEMDTSEPLTPTPVTEEIETVESVLSTAVVKQEPIEQPETVPGAIVQSVIVENKNSINHDKQIPFVERTNLFVDSMNTTEKTNDQPPGVNKSDDADTVAQNAVKNIKRTPESGRGRKRTRPRTPVETEVNKEDTLPLRKRTRRREAEARQEAIEENRTSVEIDTDTEVQVAQTLASWAAAKQERTEVKVEDSSLGNGELKMDTEGK